MKSVKKGIAGIIIAFLVLCTISVHAFASDADSVISEQKAMDEENQWSFLLDMDMNKPITEEALSDFTQQELCYARNEIYARHLRTFKSAELTEYFSMMPWYEARISPDDFDEAAFLSDQERENAKIITDYENSKYGGAYKTDQDGYDLFAVRTLGNGKSHSVRDVMLKGRLVRLPKETEMDLDGDGNSEYISYQNYDYSAELSVNDMVSSVEMAYPDSAPFGISLDGKTISLVLYDYGDSDDPVLHFHHYKDGVLEKQGEIKVFPTDVAADPSKGVLYGRQRSSVVGVIDYDCCWETDEEGMLQFIPQDYYSLSSISGETLDLELLEPIEVYEKKDGNTGSVLLNPQHVTVLYTDTSDWVYLVGDDGTEGWFHVLSYQEMGKVFQGLHYAD